MDNDFAESYLGGEKEDWDHHNWAAMRNRVKPGKGFQFLCWDAEYTLKTLNQNVTGENNSNRPSQIFRKLTGNEEFRRLFADRVQRYCSENGLLTPGPASERWIQRMNIVDGSGCRRGVHNYKTAGPQEWYSCIIAWYLTRSGRCTPS